MTARLKSILGLLAVALFASAAFAAAPFAPKPVVKITPIPPVGPSPITPDCRYLFVVDLSSAMQRSADGLYRTTHRLVASGLGGRMREGDVFTVWTYADTVLTREFPLNAWTQDLDIALANRAYEFLAQQKFRGKSNLRPVFAELGQALAISTNLTVILISDGTDVIVGTPFDRPINVTYGKRASEMRTARMPFITSLVTQRGEFTQWAVRGGLEDIGLPFPEKPVLPAPVIAQSPAPPVAKPVAPTNPPAPAVVIAPPPKASPPAPTPIPKVVVTTNVVTKPAPPLTNTVAAKLPEVVAPKPLPAPPVPAPAPKPVAVTNIVASTSPVPKPTPAPPIPKAPEAAPIVATAKLPTPGTSPMPKKSDVNLPPPAPAPKQEAKAAAPPPPKPMIETPKTPVPSPKPVVTLTLTNAPAPPVPQPVVAKANETLVLQPIPPALPPALRQPKSVIDVSNALAKVELLRPPAGTSAPTAKPLEARVIQPKPAPPKATNTTITAAKTVPPPAITPSAKKSVTNAPATAMPAPKVIPIVVPPAATTKPPSPKPAEAKAAAPPINTPVRPTSPQVAVAPKPSLPEAKKPATASEAKTVTTPEKAAKSAGQLAIATPGARQGGWAYLAAAVALLVVAGGIIAHLLRPRPHPSVISQSLDDTRV